MANQSNYKDNQIFEIDINLFYEDFIKQIDSIRGYINIASPKNLKFLNKISESDFSGLSGKLSVEQTYQESRIHAFYRLIGFPILGNNGQFYSPGHDAIKYPLDFLSRKQNKSYKLSVINNIKENFYEFSKKREEYFNTKVKEWYSYQDINTVTFLLSSYNVRNFNDHIDKLSKTFDFNFDNQSYLVKLSDSLNRSLLEYSSYTNKEQFPTKLIAKRNHNIFPFLVDPRLDLSASKRVCVPFPLNKSQAIINESYEAPRCLLEAIITQRFNDQNSSENDQIFVKSLNNFIENFTSIKDEFVINKINQKSIYSTSEKEILNKFLNLISSMMDELIDAQKNVGFVQANTYWAPICGLNGLEGPINSFSIPLLSNPKFKTSFDNDLSLFQAKDILNSITPESETPEETEFSFSSFFNSFFDTASKSFGSLIKRSADDLLKQKKFFDNSGADSLRKIEIIMGEFSGLGLCDIVAIIGGLYSMDRNYLLGLIDSDSFIRATKKLRLYTIEQPGLEESIIELNKSVFSFYNIMQKVYVDKSKFGL